LPRHAEIARRRRPSRAAVARAAAREARSCGRPEKLAARERRHAFNETTKDTKVVPFVAEIYFVVATAAGTTVVASTAAAQSRDRFIGVNEILQHRMTGKPSNRNCFISP